MTFKSNISYFNSRLFLRFYTASDPKLLFQKLPRTMMLYFILSESRISNITGSGSQWLQTKLDGCALCSRGFYYVSLLAIMLSMQLHMMYFSCFESRRLPYITRYLEQLHFIRVVGPELSWAARIVVLFLQDLFFLNWTLGQLSWPKKEDHCVCEDIKAVFWPSKRCCWLSAKY